MNYVFLHVQYVLERTQKVQNAPKYYKDTTFPCRQETVTLTLMSVILTTYSSNRLDISSKQSR